MKLIPTLGAAIALLAATPTTAATIGNIGDPNINNTFQIDFFKPLGQSFTAVDNALLSIGFAFNVINPNFPVTPITIDLYVGAGTGGPILASRTFNLANPSAIFDADFSGTTLTVGQAYTAALSAGGSAYQGVRVATSGVDSFAGGQAFSPNLGIIQACASGTCDLAFRVIGETVVGPGVPEPASWAMMLTGFALAGAATRRTRLRVATASA